MKLNHLNLAVTDVRAAGAFLETYFGLRNVGEHAGMAFLSDEDGEHGFVLTLSKAKIVAYPATSHIGFFIDSEEIVNDIHRRLKADGFDVAAPQRRHAYGFYVEAPGGFTVELGA